MYSLESAVPPIAAGGDARPTVLFIFYGWAQVISNYPTETTLCPFIKTFTALIKREFPGINIVMGTHQPADRDRFQRGVKELLCQTLARPQTMNDLIRGTLKIPPE
jgi:hypothetical protein